MPASLAASARGKPSSAPAIACMRAAAARSFSRRASRRSSSAGRSVRIVSARPPICVLPQPGRTQPESLRPASTQITSESANSRAGMIRAPVYRTRLPGQWVALCGAPEGRLLPGGAHVSWTAVAVLLDRPLGVVAGDEGADGVAHVVDGPEDATVHDLLLLGPKQ